MKRILYGAPESELEEENGLVAKLRDRRRITYKRDKSQVTYTRETHQVEYLNDFLGFVLELPYCKNLLLLPPKYDLVMYDTRTYGENWLPEIRAESFKDTITPYFKKKELPIIVLADEEIKEKIKAWVEEHHFQYIAQPYSINEVVAKVNSFLKRSPRKKEQ